MHVVMTDHSIQRVKPDRDLLAPMAEVANEPQGTDAVVPYYPPQLPRNAENELYLATAEVKHGSQSGIGHLESAILKYSPAAPDFYFELGDGYARAGKSEAAVHWYKEALRRKPGYRPALKQMAAALISRGDYAPAIDVLRQAVAAPPPDEAIFTDSWKRLSAPAAVSPGTAGTAAGARDQPGTAAGAELARINRRAEK